MKSLSGLFAALCLGLSGCITLPREDGPPAAPADALIDGFPSSIRTVGLDRQYMTDIPTRVKSLKGASDGKMDFLALSGGGAGGSFGAGVLLGLTKSGNRPQFEVVTGVSTGALIAPFAFLGEEWDGQLAEAFSTDAAAGLLVSRGFQLLFKPSFFMGEPLEGMVEKFVTPELIDAVAQEAEKGRILMVATTNLDLQQTVYWNLGEIAKARNEKARRLFSRVLVASASVPGVFPPVMIPVEADGKHYEEMHVDGGATLPFFLGPELWALSNDPMHLINNANIYIVMNGQLQAPSSSTPVNTVQIIARAFESMLIFSGRTALSEYAVLSTQRNMNFHASFIPTDLAFAGPLEFDTEERQRLFTYAQACARQDKIWFTSETLPFAFENSRVRTEDLKKNFGVPKFCPTEIEKKEKEKAAEKEAAIEAEKLAAEQLAKEQQALTEDALAKTN